MEPRYICQGYTSGYCPRTPHAREHATCGIDNSPHEDMCYDYCMGCIAVIKETKQHHKCGERSCGVMTVNNKYCRSHRCRYCRQLKPPELDSCLICFDIEKCVRCDNRLACKDSIEYCHKNNIKQFSCISHMCGLHGCKAAKKETRGENSERYCETHTCNHKDCYVLVIGGYCNEHKPPLLTKNAAKR